MLLPLASEVKMPTFNVSQDACGLFNWDFSDASSDWNGNGPYVAVGSGPTNTYLYRAGINFSGFIASNYPSVSSATLSLTYYNVSGNNVLIASPGVSRVMEVYLATVSVTDSGGNLPFSPSTSWTNYASNGYTAELNFKLSTLMGTPVTKTIGASVGDGNVITIDVTSLLNYCITNNKVFKGFVLKMQTEQNQNYGAQFSAGTATLAVTGAANSTPTAPTIVTTGGAKTTGSLVATYNDPDAADTMSMYMVEVNTSSTFTTALYNSGWVADTTSAGSNFSHTPTATLTYGTTYYWRAKVKDAAGAESPWSAGTDTFGINTKPSTPTGLSPTGAQVVDSLTPVFSASASDPDPSDSVTNAKILVYRKSDNVKMWDSGYFTITNGIFTKTYGFTGTVTALSYNTDYYWTCQVKDSNGAASSVSSASYFKTFIAGVTNMQPSTNYLDPSTSANTGWVKTLTPSLNFVTPSNMSSYQLKFYDSNGNLIVTGTKTTVSPVATTLATAYTYALTPALVWGTKYQWTVTWWDTASTPVQQAESTKAVFYTNSAPVPSNTAPANNAAIITINPSFDIGFNDQDLSSNGFPDAPTSAYVEVSRSSDSLIMYNLTKSSSLSSVINTLTQQGSGVSGVATAAVTGVVGSAGTVTYTCSAGHPFSAGQVVTMTGINPVAYNLVNATVLGSANAPTSTTFKVSNATTTAFVSGGTATSTGTISLVKNTQYRYRSRYTDSSGATNATGDWSPYVSFKPTDAPTIAIINNGSSSGQYTNSILNDDITSLKLNNPMPTFSYTFTGAYGKTQTARRLVIYETVSGGAEALVYDSGYTYTSNTTFDAPDGYIKNAASYRFLIEAHDSDDLDSNMLSISIIAQWYSPSNITGIVILENNGSLKVSWDQSSDANFVRYNVYRRQGSSSSWSLLSQISSKSTTSYVDYSAGVGTAYQYTVTQTSLPASSHEIDSDIDATQYVEASNGSDNWWFVVDGNDRLSVELYVDSEDRNEPYQEEVFEPFGRSRKVVVRYAQYGVEGNITSIIPSDEVSVKLPIIKEIAADVTNPVYIKTPFGDVYKAYLGNPSYSYTSGGNVNYSVSYVEVE